MDDTTVEAKGALDLSKPMSLRAEMARGGIAPMQTRPYDDPEYGYVDPLADDEMRTTVRRFLGALWRACERAEAQPASALPDPRPTEAEAYDGYRGEVPVIGWDMWEYLRELGCFRPEPAAFCVECEATHQPDGNCPVVPAEPVPAAEPPTRHRLKVWPEFYASLADGTKPFEVRYNDRGFQVGDWLDLCEWDNAWTGAACTRTVTYVLDLANYFYDQGCTAWPSKYVVLGLATLNGSGASTGVPMVTVRRQVDMRMARSPLREVITYEEQRVPADQIPSGWEPT